MGILDGIVQTIKKTLDNKKIKYPADTKQIFRYTHQAISNLDATLAIHAIPFLSFSETNSQSEPRFDLLFAGDIEKANVFLAYLSTFELAIQIVDFLSVKKELQSNLLIDFEHADFLVYKQNEKLLCNIKLKRLTVTYINNAKCDPIDLTLDLQWQGEKFSLYSVDNSDNKIMQPRENKKEISFLTFRDKCISEYDKLLTHQNFIFKYTRIKELDRNTQDSDIDGIFLKKIFSYLEKVEKESENIVILLPIESLVLKYHMADIVYSFLKYKENELDNYNFIKNLLVLVIENFNFFEAFDKKINFLVCLNKYINSVQYDDLYELDKAYKELPKNTWPARSAEPLQRPISGLFRFHKESYIELINVLLISFKAKSSVANLAYSSLIKIKFNELSIKDLNHFILFIYQYRLLLEDKIKKNNTLSALNKLYNTILSKKKSSILEVQYLNKFGLNIKKNLEEFVLVAEDSRSLDKFFEAKPELKQVYEGIKDSLALSVIDYINKKILFEIIEKFIICNWVTLPALQAIHQWIRLTEKNLDISITANELKDPPVFLVTPCVEFAVEGDKRTGKVSPKLFVDKESNLSLKVGFTQIENAAKVALVNKQQTKSENITPDVLNKDKFSSKLFQSINIFKKNLSKDEIDQLKVKVNEELHLVFSPLHKKNSLNLKTLLGARYHTLPENIKILLEKFLNKVNGEINASAIIFLALEKNTQQIKALKNKQADCFQQLKINSRAFIVRLGVYIYNQKKIKAQCDSVLAFMRFIFSRVKQGYFYKDRTFLDKLTRHIIVFRKDGEKLDALFKRELLKVSWFDLLIKYRVMRWPWQEKKSFVTRFSKYMYCIFYLQKINVLKQLQKDLKSRIEFLDPTETSISTVADIKTFALKIKALTEEILEIYTISKNSSELQKEATEIISWTEKNTSLCVAINATVKKSERLELIGKRTHQNVLIFVEQLVEILQSKNKDEANYAAKIRNFSVST